MQDKVASFCRTIVKLCKVRLKEIDKKQKSKVD
jgi:hypothetical protein